mmetsp:Transcript_12755/g.46667  ORF Transcript_12755/g.46667 Transcript_12755/m.46667 type:complete len:375 (+) Transcript_12755:266-1390(+)
MSRVAPHMNSAAPLVVRLRLATRSKGGRRNVLYRARPLASTAVDGDRNQKNEKKLGLKEDERALRVLSHGSSSSSSTKPSTHKPSTRPNSRRHTASSNASLASSRNASQKNARASVQCHSSVDASSLEGSDDNSSRSSSAGGLFAAGGALAGGLGLLIWAGVTYHDQINALLDGFSAQLEGQGWLAYVYFSLVYAGLEVLCVPAIPLTVSAGALFGTVQGTAVVSLSSNMAAAVSFLLARYLLRDRIEKVAKQNPRFSAIDKKVGSEGFKLVAMLRLSPLLPMAVSNYLYGLTSLKFKDYVIGTWLGMLPGTAWYVMAGSVGRSALKDGFGENVAGGSVMLGLGVLISVFTAGYVTRVIQSAIDSADEQAKPQP